MSSDQADDLRPLRTATPALPAILRAAAVRLPFDTTAAAPRPGDTLDLSAVLAAAGDAPDLGCLGPALAAVLAPLRGAGGTPADQAAAMAALRAARPGPADLALPGWIRR